MWRVHGDRGLPPKSRQGCWGSGVCYVMYLNSKSRTFTCLQKCIFNGLVCFNKMIFSTAITVGIISVKLLLRDIAWYQFTQICDFHYLADSLHSWSNIWIIVCWWAFLVWYFVRFWHLWNPFVYKIIYQLRKTHNLEIFNHSYLSVVTLPTLSVALHFLSLCLNIFH